MKSFNDRRVMRASNSPFSGDLPGWFLSEDPDRVALWNVCSQCIEGECTMDDVVKWLAPIVPTRSSPRQVLSSQTEPPKFRDLGPEIKVLDRVPITGGGFCDIWIGEWLGQKKVALKILRACGVPDQIRKVCYLHATDSFAW